MLGGKHIVDSADGRLVRSGFHLLGILTGFMGYLTHHVDETVERFLRLVLGGLNHQTLMEEQREIDGGRMVAVVEQPFGYIHGGDAC